MKFSIGFSRMAMQLGFAKYSKDSVGIDDPDGHALSVSNDDE